MKEKSRAKSLISEYFIFVIFIALVVVLTCLKPSFIQPANLVNILKQASINGILAFGMMFVIIAGGFDMSVGSTVAFTGILAAMLGQGQYPIFVPLIVAMLGGLAVGVSTAWALPWATCSVHHDTGNHDGGPWSCPPDLRRQTHHRNQRIVQGCGGVFDLRHSHAGGLSGDYHSALLLRAVEDSLRPPGICLRRKSAGSAGLRHQHHQDPHLHLCHRGASGSLSGFLMTSRVTIAQPTAAESYEMDAITACVVGGVSMTGGVGKLGAW